MTKYLRLFCVVALLCVAATGLIYAQAVNASLVGTITDSSGAVVPSARVTIMETNTGVSRNTKTGDAGNYVFADVPPGTYSVSVELTAFKKTVRAGVDVLVNTTVRVDLALQLGNISETVSVVAEVPVLQTDRSDTAVNIEESQLATILFT